VDVSSEWHKSKIGRFEILLEKIVDNDEEED
jgi:hypothetical protein